MKNVEIYTDGACSGNPGPGGYGIILLYKEQRKEFSKGYKLTTNNRMETMAVIKALKLLKEPCNITLYTDSSYVVNSINKGWVYNWKNNNWKNSSKKDTPNVDLWEELLLLLEIHKVNFVWVKGHADNEGNNRCDFLARQAMKSENLSEDVNYRP
ncbi:ribonuclease HI [[Clostridium] colinum]|uniref:ribonuclease HI n=1 Tax=[Clostridium] colinum TaxID=36835 RepID=UPI002024AEEE|nr:ribonuclease HI [[Clostridium] colinum]